MENTRKEQESELLPIGIFEIPGEPAVVINGVPTVPQTDIITVASSAASGTHSPQTIGCGEWLEGRKVEKLFMGEYYSGTVVSFDKETGWYRVEYEDGDSEDLDWQELEEVLLPLDVTIPLKSLALRIVKNRHRSSHKFGRTRKAKNSGTKGKEIVLREESDGISSVFLQNDSDELQKLVWFNAFNH